MTTDLKALCAEVLLKAKDAIATPYDMSFYGELSCKDGNFGKLIASENTAAYIVTAANSAETLAQALLDKMTEIERKDRALEVMRFALDRINDTPNLNGPEADRALPYAKLAWMLAARALAKAEQILGKGNG